MKYILNLFIFFIFTAQGYCELPTYNAKSLNFQSQALNDKGQVLATVYAPQQKGALYTRGIDGEYNLFNLNPELGFASDINNKGQIVGKTLADSNVSFLWTPTQQNGIEGNFVTFNGAAEKVNDLGSVVVNDYSSNSAYCYNCVTEFYSLSNFYSLGGPVTRVYNLNNNGLAVGEAYLSYLDSPLYDYPSRAVLYTQSNTNIIGTLGGHFGGAQAISNSGIIVGWMSYSTNINYIYDSHAVVFGNGLKDIHPGGSYSYAQDVNENGEVVGGYDSGGFYYKDGLGSINLNNLLDSESTNVNIYAAKAINNCGQVLVDADGGSAVLSPHNLAFIFQQDPITATGNLNLKITNNDNEMLLNNQRSCVTLDGLSGTKLEDPNYAKEVLGGMSGINLTDSATKVYDYRRNSKDFHAVNTYYHTKLVTKYVHETLGLTDKRTQPVQFAINYNNEYAGYVRPLKTILMGTIPGGGANHSPNENQYVSTAEDPQAIWHENAHEIMEEFNLAFQTDILFPEEYAVGEAIADFFAVTAFPKNDQYDDYFAKWSASNLLPILQYEGDKPNLRTLVDRDTQKPPAKYPDTYIVPSDPNNEDLVDDAGHKNSVILSRALWELLSDINKVEITNKAFNAIAAMAAQEVRNLQGFSRLFYEQFTDDTIKNKIKEVFLKRGLFNPITSININNTNVVSSGATVPLEINFFGLTQIGGSFAEITSSNENALKLEQGTEVNGNKANIDSKVISDTFSLVAGTVNQDTSVDITVNYGIFSKTQTVVVKPANFFQLFLNKILAIGGRNILGTITLNSPAPAGGQVVYLQSNDPTVTVPVSVKVAAGQLSRNFTITTTPVEESKTADISATVNSQTQTVAIEVQPPALSAFSLTPRFVELNQSSTAIVRINGDAPENGALVTITSDNPNAQISYPATVLIPAGSREATFVIGTSNQAETISLTASYKGVSLSRLFKVLPTPDIYSLTLTPSRVVVSNDVTIRVALNRIAPQGGTTVNISASNNLTVPNTIFIPEGQRIATAVISTQGLTPPATFSITASVISSLTKQLRVVAQ